MLSREEIKQRLSELHATRKVACIGAEDMFWSPQDKEKYLEEIDEEIRLTEEDLEKVRNGKTPCLCYFDIYNHQCPLHGNMKD